MTSRGAHHCSQDVLILSADWGKEAKKRAVYAALQAPNWRIRPVKPPADGWNLPVLLKLGRYLRDRYERPVIIGIDVVLGLPEAFVQRAGASGFLEELSILAGSGGLIEESASTEEWTPQRPFFRVPAGKGGLTTFIETAGGKPTLLREIELLTGGNTVFALSGIPGTVGSGSRALWKELAPAVSDPTRDFKLWPFDGTLAELTSNRNVILAEIYPRAAYSTALEDALPAPPETVAKTKTGPRRDALDRLLQASWPKEIGAHFSGLNEAADGEDDFDALITAAAMVRLIAENRPLSCDLVDPVSEGGILPTGAIAFPPRAPHGRPRKRRERLPYKQERDDQVYRIGEVCRAATGGLRCPIEGCTKVYAQGRLGWDSHVGSWKRHPLWRPDTRNPEERKRRFKEEFADWF